MTYTVSSGTLNLTQLSAAEDRTESYKQKECDKPATQQTTRREIITKQMLTHSRINNLNTTYLVLCNDTTLVAQHVLPHEVWLFKLHRTMYRHLRINSYPQHWRIRAEQYKHINSSAVSGSAWKSNFRAER